jgi:hypothetical protein
MASTPCTLHVTQPAPDDGHQVRLTLKPRAPVTGRVDGGWWPRSRDLAAEIPALQHCLTERMGTVERVSYHLGDWGTTTRRILLDGHVVRLAGYRTQHAATIDVLGVHDRLTLLVVSPDAAPAAAHAVLAAAARPGNTAEVQALLRTTDGTGDATDERPVDRTPRP